MQPFTYSARSGVFDRTTSSSSSHRVLKRDWRVGLLVVVSVGLFAHASQAANCNYTIAIPQGQSMIANQCDNPSGNTLNNVFPVVPDGSKIAKFNCQTQVWGPISIFNGGTWSPNQTLDPGEGAWFFNPGAAFSLNISGDPHTPVLPLVLPANACCLLSRQEPLPGGFTDIIGLPPQEGDSVFKLRLSGGFDPYDYSDGAWDPSEPVAAVGQSMWICRGGSPTSPPDCEPVIITQQPTNTTVAICTSVINCVTFAVAATGTAPLSYQWCTNGVLIAGATSSSFTFCPVTSAHDGTLFTVKITNSCSSITSQVATLTVRVDTMPPIVACPQDIVTNTEPGQCFRVVAFSASATDNCDTNPVVNCMPVSGAMFGVGTTNVICVATDAAGNSNSCSFTVTVRDNERPAITCPADLVICADPGQISKSNVTYAITATDNCPGVTFSCDPPSGETFLEGATPVSCIATDAAGNSNRCVFTVVVNANTSAVPLTNLTRCRGDSATYTVVTSGGGALSYGWTLDGNPIGPDSPLLVIATAGLTDGNYIVECIVTGECGTVTNRATLTVQSCVHGGPCTVTQGFVANRNGKFNGTPSITMSSNLLANAPLIVGKAGLRSLTISQNAVPLLLDRMPAGGTPTNLPNSGDQHLLTAVLPLRKGKFDNILVGQVITLSLYMRLDSSLSTFPLRTSFCTQGVSPGPDGSLGTADDVPVSGNVQTFTIPNSVLAALTDAGLGINDVTVRGLVELANRALAGLPTAGATLPDINSAVDNINRAFDFCRLLVDCVGNPITLGDGGAGKSDLGFAAAAQAMAANGSAQVLRIEGFNCEASKEPGEPDIAGNRGGKPLWWEWQATRTGLVTIQTAGSSFDTLLGVYVGPSHSNVILVAENDDMDRSVWAELLFQAMAGTKYMVVVDGYDGACGSIVLQIVSEPPRLDALRVVPGGGLRIGIEGELGRSYVVDGSSDLVTWAPVAAVGNRVGFLHFVDRKARTSPQRFYRVWIEP